jgi:phosphatidylglycerophosphatase A
MTPAHWIASGGGIGRFPIAPGTVASLAAMPVGALTLWIDPRLLALLAIATLVIGTWAIHETKEQGDPGWIVIDEFAGQWVAMLGLGHVSLYGLIAAFVLFRFFDITKPGPVGSAENLDGAFGVMADDIVAGLLAAAILFVTASLIAVLIP